MFLDYESSKVTSHDGEHEYQIIGERDMMRNGLSSIEDQLNETKHISKELLSLQLGLEISASYKEIFIVIKPGPKKDPGSTLGQTGTARAACLATGNPRYPLDPVLHFHHPNSNPVHPSNPILFSARPGLFLSMVACTALR